MFLKNPPKSYLKKQKQKTTTVKHLYLARVYLALLAF